MQKAREYARAVTAAKMDRMFAHPLIGNLGNGHRDSVTVSAVSRRSLLPLVTGSADGSVYLWDLASRTRVASLDGAHSRVVTGVVFDALGEKFYSCSDDGYVRCWSMHPQESSDGSTTHDPIASWRTSGTFKSLDHHWIDSQFATASDEAVQIWTPERNTPIQTHAGIWESHDTITTVRFNPAESNLLACCSADRGIGLFDTRVGSALRKTVLRMRTNDLQWNPMEPMNFVVANEDFNAYTFDVRKLKEPTKIYKGHTSAVTSVSFSPTGKEFATGSYDRTIRIFGLKNGTARDIYHTKRMQRVCSVNFTLDGTFIVSASDESNIRLWKARSSQQLGQLNPREESAIAYRQALIRKHRHLPEIKKIHKARRVPGVIKKQTAQAIVQKESADRKHSNRVKYSRNGEIKFVAERKKTVVKEIK